MTATGDHPRETKLIFFELEAIAADRRVSIDELGSRAIALLLQKLRRGEQRFAFLLEEIRKLVLQLGIPENLFPSISTRHDVVDGTGKLNPRRSRHPPCNHAKVISQRLTPDLLFLHARVMLSSTARRSESDNFWSVSTRDIVTALIIAAAVAMARFLASAGLAWSK